ncbi:hypothetical protein CYMTET_3271 [Cymbomonas tetramitiformis]|uniref:Uncharacterized protein n=1 Tax=Cymbomonas tetramitiformis TaxID=36881 RepID=A0AAE0LLR0_9CHLO|nr:hypothetical protein CYMTET_3271 [Cymbomonas tetramitiformis]
MTNQKQSPRRLTTPAPRAEFEMENFQDIESFRNGNVNVTSATFIARRRDEGTPQPTVGDTHDITENDADEDTESSPGCREKLATPESARRGESLNDVKTADSTRVHHFTSAAICRQYAFITDFTMTMTTTTATTTNPASLTERVA